MPMRDKGNANRRNKALPSGNVSGQASYMRRSFTERWRHFDQIILRPWVAIFLVALGFVGNAQTLVGFLPEKLSTPIHSWINLPTWTPSEWVIAGLFGLLVVLVEGSFRVRTRIEGERDDARRSLAAISAERPLSVTTIETRLSPATSGMQSAYLQGYVLTLANDGNQRIQYRVLRTEMRGAGIDAAFPPVTNPSGIIPVGRSMNYNTGIAITPLATAALSGAYEAEFEIEYDNIPPLRVRMLSMRLRVICDFIIGGRCEFVILAQSEA